MYFSHLISHFGSFLVDKRYTNIPIHISKCIFENQTNGLVQACVISIALAMEIPQAGNITWAELIIYMKNNVPWKGG